MQIILSDFFYMAKWMHVNTLLLLLWLCLNKILTTFLCFNISVVRLTSTYYNIHVVCWTYSLHVRKKACLYCSHVSTVVFIIVPRDVLHACIWVYCVHFSVRAIRGPWHHNTWSALKDRGVTLGPSLRRQLLWWGVGDWRFGRHLTYGKR